MAADTTQAPDTTGRWTEIKDSVKEVANLQYAYCVFVFESEEETRTER
jgi:hypothetical protein